MTYVFLLIQNKVIIYPMGRPRAYFFGERTMHSIFDLGSHAMQIPLCGTLQAIDYRSAIRGTIEAAWCSAMALALRDRLLRRHPPRLEHATFKP